MTMKRIYYILLILLTLVCSCDKLPLQKTYPYDPQPLDPHQGVTCWEYISSSEDLAIMKQAIEKCGLVELYAQQKAEYTYLLLDDTAFNSYIFTQLEAGSVADADADKATPRIIAIIFNKNLLISTSFNINTITG